MKSDRRVHRRLRVEELEPRIAPTAADVAPSNLPLAQNDQAMQAFNAAPLVFVQNQGQVSDADVRFLYQGPNSNILFTDSGPVFQMFQREDTGLTREGPDANAVVHATVFRTTFEGANPVEPVAANPLTTRVNYLIGSSADQWQQDLQTYATVVYPGLFDGIDLYASGSRAALKYEFHVAPGADPSRIVVSYEGIDGLSLDDAGVLHIRTPRGEMLDQAPVIYQDIGGQRVPVAGAYRIIDQDTYGFQITGAYDTTKPLVVDPELLWTSFLGTAEEDCIRGVALEGNYAYVTGWTYGSGFPTKSAYDTSFNRGNRDAFVAKFDLTLTGANSLIYSTYLGGNDDDAGQAISVKNGYAFVSGGTRSTNFPTTALAYQTTYQGGEDYGDAFAVQLGTAGTSLFYSTYLGGSAGDWAQGVVGDYTDANSPITAGHYVMYVGGFTYSADFPTQQGPGGIPGVGEPNPHQSTLGGLSDGFLTGIITDANYSVSGNTVFYSSYYGGSLEDYILAISLTNDQWHDDVELTGFTYSPDLPMDTAHGGLMPGNGFDQTYNGGADAFDTRMCVNLGRLEGATYIGGSGDDYGYGVINHSVHPPENTYEYGFVVGRTYSTDFPTTANALDRTYNGGDGDAFLTIAANSGWT